MTFRDQVALDFQNTFLEPNEFAGSVTYHATGGDVGIDAVFVEDPPQEVEDEQGALWEIRTGSLWISTDAVLGVASPVKAEEVTIDSLKWSVDGPPSDEIGVWHIRVRRSVPQSRVAARVTMPRV